MYGERKELICLSALFPGVDAKRPRGPGTTAAEINSPFQSDWAHFTGESTNVALSRLANTAVLRI